MFGERWRRLRAAYESLLDADESERPAIIAAHAESDPEFGRELAALLAGDATTSSFLDHPLVRLKPPNLNPGMVLCERFVLLHAIGQGGMGEVWAARDETLKEQIAIKTISLLAGQTASLPRFKREIQLARRISHPNVCRVYELFEDTDLTPPRTFLTMELLAGETLAARLARVGALPVEEAIEVCRQVAAGLGAAHDSEVIHRDLKPANIMLLSSSSGRRAVVMDFGLARDPAAARSDGVTVTGAVVGTPEYMAPEQVSGGPLSPATDIYALGLILFEMLRGKSPFAGGTTLESLMRRAREGPERLSGVIPGLPARIDSVIARCLAYEPARRYQDTRQLLRALDSSLHIAVPRSRRLWIAVAAAAVLLVALAGVAAWRRANPPLPSADALRWYSDAQQALAESAPVRALNNITRAITLAPDFAPAHAALAEIRLDLDLPSAAQEAMLRANELARDRSRYPQDYVQYMDAVQALLQHQCDRAIAAFAKASETAGPDRPYRMVTTARAMDRCGRPHDAHALMTDASRIDPRNAAVPLRAARFAASDRNYEGAAALLGTAEGLFRDRNNIEGLGEVLLLRGTFEVEQDRLDAGRATLARAIEVAGSLNDVRQQIRVRLQQAILNRKSGDLMAATDLTTQAIDLGRRSNLETLTLEGLFAAANVHMIRNQFGEAETLFERVKGIAETYRHEEYRARAYLSLASAYVQTLRPDQAAAAIQVARPYYEKIGHTRNLAIADALMGQVRLARMEYVSAIEQFQRAADAAKEKKDPEQERQARDNLANALAGAGRYPDAVAQYRQVMAMHNAAGRSRAALFAQLNLADLLSRLGRTTDALAALKDASPGPSKETVAQLKRIEAAVKLRSGDLAGAERAALEALKVGADLSPERTARAAMILCLAAARQRHVQYVPRCDAIEADTSLLGNPSFRFESRLAVAEARLALGNIAGAAPLLRQAREILKDGSENEHRWRLLALSKVAAEGGGDVVSDAAELTRELDRLRLIWGNQIFTTWSNRSDVTALIGGLASRR